jgi:hypothetical protein
MLNKLEIGISMYTLEQVSDIYYTHGFFTIYSTILQFIISYFEPVEDNVEYIMYQPVEDIVHPMFDYVVIQAR